MSDAITSRATGEHPEGVFLRPDVRLEPLIYRWHAWPYLIAPATHAMNLAFRHLPKLNSFLANPDLHINAAKDPATFGGSHLTLSTKQVPAARGLTSDLQKRCARHLEFARSYQQLNDKLQSRANGYSLEEYYKALPPSLAGRLELVYDLNQHPRIKVIEELLYGSDIDTAEGQQISLYRTADTAREFFMSSPELGSEARILLDTRFSDPRIDELARTRTTAVPLDDLRRRLQVGEEQRELFESFFSSEPPSRLEPRYTGPDVRVRYFGHACVLLETAEQAVLLDPLTAWRRDRNEASLTFDDLPDFIDYVVITHAHQDHFVTETLLQLRHRIGTLVVPANARGNLADPSLPLMLQHMGFRNVRSIQPFGDVGLQDGRLTSVPFIGEHGGLDVESKHCVMVRMKGRGFLFLVDSVGTDAELYRSMAPHIGKIDVLFVSMECHGAPMSWLYGPLMSRPLSRRDDESRRLSAANCERAWMVVRELQCAQAFIYAMGQEPWLTWLMGRAYSADSVQLKESARFVDRCRNAGIPAELLYGCREMTF